VVPGETKTEDFLLNWINWLIWLVPLAVSLLAIGLWVLTLVGLPGNWGLLIVAATTAYFAPSDQPLDVSVTVVVGMGIVAIVGEALEFAASALGVNKLGGSKKGSAMALVGSIVGAIAGMILGVPIPVVGSLIAAVVFGCFGAFGGAILGEHWDGKDWPEALKIGWGAFWGRLIGTVLKTLCGTVLLVTLLVSVWTTYL
jgi:hypothetical protein